jgi:general secretion pathway protein H
MISSRLFPIFLLIKVGLVVLLSSLFAIRGWIWPRVTRRTFRVRRPTRQRIAPRCNGKSGFTLIEIGVVLMVVAMMIGLAIPSLASLSGIQARAEVNKLAANIRATRGHAAVSGQTCRMTIDIGASSYLVECTSGQIQVANETVRNGEREKTKDEKPDKDLTDAEKMKRKVMKRIQFASSQAVPPQKLKGNLTIESVWTSHQEDKYTKGVAYLYFFPSGTSESANIVLRYGDDFYTVQLSPLAGKVKVLGKKAELPGERDDF